jgi:hypothetical protein
VSDSSTRTAKATAVSPYSGDCGIVSPNNEANGDIMSCNDAERDPGKVRLTHLTDKGG